MDLDDFLLAGFCVVEEALPHVLGGRRGRQRGPAPPVAESEVLTMDVVGESRGVEQEKALFAYFRQHYAHFFPALRTLHRTTFVRQAASPWRLKERLWQHVLAQIAHDPTFAILDSLPLPVCQFARASRCRRFREEAAFGKEALVRQTFYGLRVHVRLDWPGVITRFCVAPANAHELTALPAVAEQTVRHPGRGPQVLVARNDHRRVAAARRHGAGALSQCQARSPSALERAAQPYALPQ